MSHGRVVITGFMGAGKTTVGRALARLLGETFIDLDDAVRELEGRGPRELIDVEGEEYFRAAETRALQHVLEEGTACVVATGGGAWTLARNRSLVAAHGCLSVWLDAPFELCLQRIEDEGCRDSRPFARDSARALALYEQRLAAYQQADLRVRVTQPESAEELAAEIVAALAAGR
ncbi:MAG: shikimate kinase [Acidobacteriota bacterium]|jgi:shikimate kinase|nr:shikimate kinase [Acidobacteriota bacterium]